MLTNHGKATLLEPKYHLLTLLKSFEITLIANLEPPNHDAKHPTLDI